MLERRRARAAALALAVALCACVTPDPDPTVLVRTDGGVELGVSTTHGVVFLGTKAVSGEAEVVAWYGDGPSLEPTLIEAVGPGLYTVDVDVDLPAVPITFDLPAPGDLLVVRGRDDAGPWERDVRAAGGVSAEGLLLEPPAEVLPAESLGAGVFARDRRGRLRLVGVLCGRALFVDELGQARDLLCALGPADLWQVVSYRRNRHRPQPWVYRPDLE